jgi:hypothetical protein
MSKHASYGAAATSEQTRELTVNELDQIAGGTPNVTVNGGCPCSKSNLAQLRGRDHQRAASPILRSSTLIAMMQAADLREADYVVARAG